MESWPVDVAISVTHLLLAAWDRGLGTCWIGDFDEEKVKEICEIPPEVRVVAIVPMGYPVKIPQATSRRPWEKIVSIDVYKRQANYSQRISKKRRTEASGSGASVKKNRRAGCRY